MWASINVHRVGHVINYWRRRRQQRHRRRCCRKALISLHQPVIGIRDLLRDIRHFHNVHRKVIGIGPFMCVRKLEWLRPSVCDLFEQKFRRVKFERGNYYSICITCTLHNAHCIYYMRKCILIPEKNLENKVNLITFNYILFYFFLWLSV